MLQNVDEMRKVLNRRLILRQLKPRGMRSIIFGVIAVFVGISSMREEPANLILAALGVFLVIEGIWLLKAPSARAFIIDGCMLITVGIWNIIVTVFNGPEHSESLFFGILGILQIIWGMQSFSKCARASEALSMTTTEEAIKRLDDLVTVAIKSNFKTNPAYIQMNQKTFWMEQIWKGLLVDDIVLLVGTKTQAGIIAQKDDFIIVQKGKHKPGKKLTGKLAAGGKDMPVIIPAQTLERLQQWKPEVIALPKV